MTENWAAAWTASAQGPFPHGRETAQPDLSTLFPGPDHGASDQSFRMIIRPDIWGTQARIRLSNAHGNKPINFENIYVGLQSMSSQIFPGSNRQIKFNGSGKVTIPHGEWTTSDPVNLDFITEPDDRLLVGKTLAVSFYVSGKSGPMTYHAKALQTSYLSAMNSGVVSHSEDEKAFPYSTTSWFFLDALDMKMPETTKVIVAFGDSISDGSASTINGYDRWPDVLARRLHAKYGNTVSLINQGIGGNQILGPKKDTPPEDRLGGISALSRLERDVISMSGVSSVIWLEGINDLGFSDASSDDIFEGIRQGVELMRNKIPSVRIIGGTLTSALNATTSGHGRKSVDGHRRSFNDLIRNSNIFDGIIDFDKVTIDESTGQLRHEMVPNSSIGGPGDLLHPNRIGYQAMGMAVDIDTIVGN